MFGKQSTECGFTSVGAHDPRHTVHGPAALCSGGAEGTPGALTPEHLTRLDLPS